MYKITIKWVIRIILNIKYGEDFEKEYSNNQPVVDYNFCINLFSTLMKIICK